MKDRLVSERYALGLSAAIAGEAELEAVLDAFRDFCEIYAAHDTLATVLQNPSILLAEREGILDGILESLGSPETLRRFLRLLLRRGRIAILGQAAEVFSEIVDKRMNRVRATVTTALPLAEGRASELEKALSARSGKKVRIEAHVDAGIIGGIVVQIEGTVIDGSLRTRLERAKESLLETRTQK